MSWALALQLKVDDLVKKKDTAALSVLSGDELEAIKRLKARKHTDPPHSGRDLSLLASAADKLRVTRGAK